MSKKKYRITTSKKQFETDNDGPDYLKEENGIPYTREDRLDDWQPITKFEKRTTVEEKFDKFVEDFWIGLLILFIIFAILVGEHIEKSKLYTALVILFATPPGWLVTWLPLYGIISMFLKKIAPYWEVLSNKETLKIIKQNKWRSPLSQHSYLYESHSSRNSYSSSRYGEIKGNSYAGGNSAVNYISSSDLDKALKVLESDGKDWNKLANSTTDEERENLFSQYFKNEQKGKAANDKFNREQVWPARTETLNNILNEAEYEDEATKENLNEKIRQFDSEISNEDFQKTAREIRKYQEHKKLKDNHVKYEGRLSNKDVKAIKDVLGYVCMGCGLDPLKEYGAEMKGILEAHHKKPWAEIKENEIRTVKPDDFYILCPNCHRMIHKLNSPDDLNSLREVLKQNKKFHWWD